MAQHDVLVRALRMRECCYREAIDLVPESAVSEREMLREAIELVAVLRRVVPTLSDEVLYRAFGAPGDFGYETPIGDALARLYGVIR